jgi:hypothetical protein
MLNFHIVKDPFVSDPLPAAFDSCQAISPEHFILVYWLWCDLNCFLLVMLIYLYYFILLLTSGSIFEIIVCIKIDIDPHKSEES